MMDLFLEYDWPGNVRQLSNTIQRLMVMGDCDEIKAQISLEPGTIPLKSGLMDKTMELEPDVKEVVPLKQLKDRAGEYIERKVISHVLNITGGNKVRAAKALSISYKTLFCKMKNLGLR